MDERKLHSVPTSTKPASPKPIEINDFIRRNGEAYLPHVKVLLDHSTQVEFLVPGAIPCGNIVLMAGEPGGGKTWLAYDLAHAVCTGTQWLGRGPKCVQGPVALLNYDQPTETLGARVRKLGFTADMPLYIHSFGLTKPPGPNLPEVLMLPEQESRLNYALQHVKPRLIIVDSLRQSHNMDENSNKDMAKLMATFKKWQRFNNTTVVLIHHTAKSKDDNGGKTSARGSGEIIASADVAIKVEGKDAIWTKHRSWNIGTTVKTTFGLHDSYLDGEIDTESGDEQEIEIIERVAVKASTPLPGEVEAANVEVIVDTLNKRKGFKTTSFTDLKKACSTLDDKALHVALRNARIAKKVKFVKTAAGNKGYAIRPPTTMAVTP